MMTMAMESVSNFPDYRSLEGTVDHCRVLVVHWVVTGWFLAGNDFSDESISV
jgi:hypothetical protein